ncbi:MAG: hypothetical protein DHS20C15_01750 [Planctomycetota bacterium]|nr:MAG: hypothetical protein DHS20C15_01750 [Planctomycetota bacterium]
MKIVALDHQQEYDGTQLCSAFVQSHAADVADTSDVVLLFEGAADVPVEHLVDTEDADADRPIYSPHMAHVIIAHPSMELARAVLAQRLLGRLAADWIGAHSGQHVSVRGDDLYLDRAKLSVSVATRCARGSLIHFAVNVDTEGTPLPTAGLRELRLPAGEFLRALARLYADEMASVAHAESKVRPVT